LWVLLSMFGIRVVTRTSSALVIVFLVLLAYMIFRIYHDSDVSLAQAFTRAATSTTGSPGSRFVTALGALGGQGAALILVNADYTRYARSRGSVGVVNIAGVIMLDLVGIALGILVLTGGNHLVGDYLVRHGQATAAGASAAATQLATHNTGAYFIIIAGAAGFLLMYVAQTKVQVLNVYSGSLALANLFHVLSGRHPNRLVMILLANAVCLALIAANVFGNLAGFLTVLGMVMMGFIALAIADFYLVSKGRRRGLDPVEPVNLAGVLTLVIAVAVAYTLAEMGVFRFGFLTSTVLTLVLYPPMRKYVLKAGPV
jgi:cytosine permease